MIKGLYRCFFTGDMSVRNDLDAERFLKQMIESGQGKRDAVRAVARGLLETAAKLNEVTDLVADLSGGEIKEQTVKKFYLRIPSRFDKDLEPFDKEELLSSIQPIVMKALGIKWARYRYDLDGIEGSERSKDYYCQILAAVDMAIKATFNAGFEKGRKMLVDLAQGRISTHRFDVEGRGERV